MNITYGPQLWDGAPIDARGMKTVLIWCTSEPSVAYGLKGGPTVDKMFNQTIAENQSSGIAAVNTLANLALYTAPGGQFVELESGTGGEFYIAGQN